MFTGEGMGVGILYGIYSIMSNCVTVYLTVIQLKKKRNWGKNSILKTTIPVSDMKTSNNMQKLRGCYLELRRPQEVCWLYLEDTDYFELRALKALKTWVEAPVLLSVLRPFPNWRSHLCTRCAVTRESVTQEQITADSVLPMWEKKCLHSRSKGEVSPHSWQTVPFLDTPGTLTQEIESGLSPFYLRPYNHANFLYFYY